MTTPTIGIWYGARVIAQLGCKLSTNELTLSKIFFFVSELSRTDFLSDEVWTSKKLHKAINAENRNTKLSRCGETLLKTINKCALPFTVLKNVSLHY